MNQKIQTRQVKVSKINVKLPGTISNTATQTVEKLSEVKEKRIEAKTTAIASKQSQPIVVPVPSNNQSSGSNSQSNFMVGTSVRNKDSTFERVQMQDFWPRVA